MTPKQLQETLNNLRSLSAENEVVEFKEAKNTYDFTKLGKYFSALSNEANLCGKPNAWLIFGVEDKRHTIVGSQFRPKRKDLDSLKGEIANKTTISVENTTGYLSAEYEPLFLINNLKSASNLHAVIDKS